MTVARHFRACVVAVVERGDGAVCAFERADAPGSWQLPQGGIDKGERPIDAVWRELAEETGLGPDDVDLVGEYHDWVVYEWPAEVTGGRKGMGQAQRWFTFRVRSDEVIPKPDQFEFVAWQWADRNWLTDQVVPFRRDVYRRVLLGAT